MATEKYVTESAMKVLLQNIKDYHDNDTIDIESMTKQEVQTLCNEVFGIVLVARVNGEIVTNLVMNVGEEVSITANIDNAQIIVDDPTIVNLNGDKYQALLAGNTNIVIKADGFADITIPVEVL